MCHLKKAETKPDFKTDLRCALFLTFVIGKTCNGLLLWPAIAPTVYINLFFFFSSASKALSSAGLRLYSSQIEFLELLLSL